MARLNVAPTKSSLLALRRQLQFAKEGYDLLEQKRQILVFELMSRLNRARQAERLVTERLESAHRALREAQLDVGSRAVDRAAVAVRMNHTAEVNIQRLMGTNLPRVVAHIESARPWFGVLGTCTQLDEAMRRFMEALPAIAELAELETAITRLARELRKTQRRCNALSKVVIPNCEETIAYIVGTLEERERESFVILKMIRDRVL